MSLRTMVLRLDTMAAALITGLALASPASALSLTPASLAALPTRDWLLMGALVVLAVAIAVRLMRRDTSTDGRTDAHDLRWWRNP
jgi:hypothetical protein